MIRIAEPLPSDDGPYEYHGRFAAAAVFEFTGEFHADTDQLHLEQARWYDPTIGRWLNEEPIGFAADPSNHYCYVGNSPMQPDAADPSQI